MRFLTSTVTRAGSRRLRALPLAIVLASLLYACSVSGPSGTTLTIATVLPTTGASGAIGLSMQRAVDLAARQNATLGAGYQLSVEHVNEASVGAATTVAQVVANAQVIGVVGPFTSSTAVATLPALARAGVVAISPTVTLPGLTKADQATAEGLTFSQLHPAGVSNNFFRLVADDNAIGAAAADLALASSQDHGLASHTVFVIDDGSASGKAQSAAFQSELKAHQGVVAGSRSITVGDDINVQTAVSAIIMAAPDSVFYAGGVAGAAAMRQTLTQTGAPTLPILVAGDAANDPAWGTDVGNRVLGGYTTGLLSAQDLSKLPGAKDFVAAYKAAYPGAAVTPQSALAYDAAMDEISAIKSLIAAQKSPSRKALVSAVAAAKFAGVTGTIAFNTTGDPTTPSAFAIYTVDGTGVWSYQSSVGGAAAGG